MGFGRKTDVVSFVFFLARCGIAYLSKLGRFVSLVAHLLVMIVEGTLLVYLVGSRVYTVRTSPQPETSCLSSSPHKVAELQAMSVVYLQAEFPIQ